MGPDAVPENGGLEPQLIVVYGAPGNIHVHATAYGLTMARDLCAKLTRAKGPAAFVRYMPAHHLPHDVAK